MARTSDSPVTYLLRDPKSKKPTPINCIVRFNNNRINAGTGFKILPAFWNLKTSRVKNVVDAVDKDHINNFLSGLENSIKAIISELKAGRNLTVEAVRGRVDDYLKPQPKPEEPTQAALFSFIEQYIEQAPTRVNNETNKTVGYRTIQKYRTVLKVLREFAETYPRPLDFDTVDLEFYGAFKNYLTIGKGFTTNNVGKYIATLKVFLNEATLSQKKLGVTVDQSYREKRFKAVKEDADNIYLSEQEIQHLYNLNLTDKPRLERVRDLFVVGCYTGLRFSDFTALRPEYIKDGLIRMEQFKTQGKVVIPCHPVVKTLLEKYSGQLPQSISNQKMNDYLKELCHFAGIISKESKAQTKGGKRVTSVLEKWQMVSTHTARRSFATNMYLLGVPAITIMRITGYKTEKAFMQYIKLDEEQHAQIMAAHWQRHFQSQAAIVAE
ncbi:tyrosine-type recombinase/integrase [Spirosoma endophyticum]|uniref:Site-specific recombinase XerD n=1 Tax=Spirosoma endophyticum TaxID=662367 RepID=A0A1I1X8Z9_9BACT|nr:phage integrase SAM-like domain-containing protein [Spirosoma endophyticum]SFE03896.1 Site-specific recombinase XerD [Spirosoma endophyticum]